MSGKVTGSDGSALSEWLSAARPGWRVRFAEERCAYTVQARGKRYLVCTKPFPLRKTVLYTVVDLQERVRGTENLVFGAGAESRAACTRMVQRLEGKSRDFHTQISYRNRVPLRVTAVLTAHPDTTERQP
jgi:hypothetical protein